MCNIFNHLMYNSINSRKPGPPPGELNHTPDQLASRNHSYELELRVLKRVWEGMQLAMTNLPNKEKTAQTIYRATTDKFMRLLLKNQQRKRTGRWLTEFKAFEAEVHSKGWAIPDPDLKTKVRGHYHQSIRDGTVSKDLLGHPDSTPTVVTMVEPLPRLTPQKPRVTKRTTAAAAASSTSDEEGDHFAGPPPPKRRKSLRIQEQSGPKATSTPLASSTSGEEAELPGTSAGTSHLTTDEVMPMSISVEIPPPQESAESGEPQSDPSPTGTVSSSISSDPTEARMEVDSVVSSILDQIPMEEGSGQSLPI